MKIGFMGGSFDPVHLGHLIIAQDVREQLALDRMVFVPAAQAPLKPNEVQAPAEDRLAMLRLAVEDAAGMEVDDCELRRGGVSYTVETVRDLRRRYPQDDLYWVIGADQVGQLAKWREIGELVKLVKFACVARPGFALEPAAGAVPGLQLHHCQAHLVEISSSELRRRIREGRPVAHFCPQKVVAYIGGKGLYR